MEKTNLNNIGLTERFEIEATMYEDNLFLARVSVQHKDKYKIITEEKQHKLIKESAVFLLKTTWENSIL